MLWLRMLFTRMLLLSHCTEKCSADLHMFAAKEQNLNFVIFLIFLLGVMLQICHN